MTEARFLEKLTLKNVKMGGQSRKRKSKSRQLNDVCSQARRHTGRARWICLFSRTLTSTELGGEGSEYFAGPGNLTALSQSEGSCLEIHEKVMIADDRSDTHSISERRESRFSPSAPSSSVNPACTKQPRQSLLWCTRTTPQQCGHSSCSCGVAVRESVRLVKSIFHCPSRLLVAEGAPFVYYFKAIHRPEAVSLVMINCVT